MQLPIQIFLNTLFSGGTILYYIKNVNKKRMFSGEKDRMKEYFDDILHLL